MRPFAAAVFFGVLLTGLLWMRPSLGGGEFVVGFVLILGLIAVLPICILILIGRRPKPGVLTKRQAVLSFILVALGLPLLVGMVWADGRSDVPAFAILVGVLGTILIFDIPLCVLILVGYPPTMTFTPLFRSSSEGAKWRELRQRPFLSDDEFFERYYSGSPIPRELPVRLRRIYSEQLGMDRLQPDDVTTEFDSEIDHWDLLAVVQDEFGIELSLDEARRLDGTFDSVVRAVAGKLSNQVDSVEPA